MRSYPTSVALGMADWLLASSVAGMAAAVWLGPDAPDGAAVRGAVAQARSTPASTATVVQLPPVTVVARRVRPVDMGMVMVASAEGCRYTRIQ